MTAISRNPIYRYLAAQTELQWITSLTGFFTYLILTANFLLTVVWLVMITIQPVKQHALLSAMHLMALAFVPLISAVYATLITAHQRSADHDMMVKLTGISKRKVVRGYYAGVHERLHERVFAVESAIAALALLRIVGTSLISHQIMAEAWLLPLIGLPLSMLYIHQINNIAAAFGVWAGFRFGNVGAPIMILIAIFGFPAVAACLALLGLAADNSRLAYQGALDQQLTLLCFSFVIWNALFFALAASRIMPAEMLVRAERWVFKR